MTTTFLESQGTQLKRGDAASPEVFTLVPQCTSLDGPDGQASEIDITTLDSTAKEFAVGLQDEGTITVEGIWNPANTQHQGLRTDKANRTLRNWQILGSDSPPTQIAFSAYVQSFSVSFQPDGVGTFSMTLRISGAVTIT